ncbi:MAG: hypothetical protein WCW65_02235 [Candidatus Paceibacterota bacterium]|jgi:hypothetical protein
MNEILMKFFASIGFTTTDATNFNFTDSPIEASDKVLADMNLLEKTCLMFIKGKMSEDRELRNQLKEMVECDDIDIEALTKLEHQYELLRETINAVKGILWTSIKGRVQGEPGSAGMRLRNDNTIVASFREEDEEGSFLPGGMMIIGMSRM